MKVLCSLKILRNKALIWSRIEYGVPKYKSVPLPRVSQKGSSFFVAPNVVNISEHTVHCNLIRGRKMQKFSSSADISEQTNETQMGKECFMHGRITKIRKVFLLDSLED